MSMDNRQVLVTGASSGIGRATARCLVDAGFVVWAGVRKEKDGEALREALGERLRPVLCDVTDADAVHAAAERLHAETGPAGLAGW